MHCAQFIPFSDHCGHPTPSVSLFYLHCSFCVIFIFLFFVVYVLKTYEQCFLSRIFVLALKLLVRLGHVEKIYRADCKIFQRVKTYHHKRRVMSFYRIKIIGANFCRKLLNVRRRLGLEKGLVTAFSVFAWLAVVFGCGKL